MNDTSTWGRLVIAGGSGFLGTSLAQHLVDRGASVVVLSRGAPKIAGKWKHVPWDARALGEWRLELDGGLPAAQRDGF